MWQVDIDSGSSMCLSCGNNKQKQIQQRQRHRQRATTTTQTPTPTATTTTTTTTAAATTIRKTVRISRCCCYYVGITLMCVLLLFTNLAHAAPTTTSSTVKPTTTTTTTTTTTAAPVLAEPQQQTSARVHQCREGCFEKFTTKEVLCQQTADCLTCWNECAKMPPPKLNKSIRETWNLHTVSMLQQDSLVLVDVAWAPLSSTPNQCLVTWEVAGGGLMGNLLTESFNVQLSLWPDTKYRVQVTCKNKLSGAMTRSLPLTIDTADSENSLLTHTLKTENTKKKLTLLQAVQRISDKPTFFESAPRPSVNSDLINNNVEKHVDTNRNEENEVEEDIDPNAELPLPSPYDDEQSSESLNQHTNFIFNWHARNRDISAIEPLQKPELNLLHIVSLSDLQKPLLFGVLAGTLLLSCVLLIYICMLRQQRVAGDKAALIDEDSDAHTVVVSLPPAVAVARPLSRTEGSEENCRTATNSSRNALKV